MPLWVGNAGGRLRRNTFSIKPRLVFGTAGNTTNRRVPHPLRSLQRVGYAPVGIEICGIPPFAKDAKDGAPGDLLHSLPRTRNAPFHIPRVGNAGGRFKEHEVRCPTKPYRKSGGWATRALFRDGSYPRDIYRI